MKKLAPAILAAVLLSPAAARGDMMVPLPPVGQATATAHRVFAEIFLQVTSADNPLGLAPGVYSHIGVGWTRDADGNGTTGDNAFVLFAGALAKTAAAPDPPAVILQIDPTGQAIRDMLTGKNDWENKSTGRLFATGSVLTIVNPVAGSGVTYNVGDGDPNPNPQITFSLYDAHIEEMSLQTVDLGERGGIISSQIQIGGEHTPHLDFYADATPDAGNGAPPGGRRYQSVGGTAGSTPEPPLRDDDLAHTLLPGLDDGTYYDRNASGWGQMDWTGNPADDDFVMWSLVGNEASALLFRQVFEASAIDEKFLLTWDAGTPGDASDDVTTTVYTGAFSEIISVDGQFVPGASLAPAGKLAADGEGFLNHLLVDDEPYIISGNFASGGLLTGAYDSDPNTWTFQQEPNGITSATKFSGPTIPEPTVLCLLLVGGGLLVCRHRARRIGRRRP